MSVARHFLSSCSSLFYPSRCGLCGVLGDEPVCPTCLQDFVPTDSLHEPLDGGPLKVIATVFPYDGRVGQAVRRLKYSRATSLAGPLAALLAEAQSRLGLDQYDLVVPIPIHWSRRCVRGFNQSELLCERMPAVDRRIVRRIRRTKPQASLTREQRLTNLEGAFRADASVARKSVLLVDDVLTTGHTARECARALIEAGAAEVAALALAGERA